MSHSPLLNLPGPSAELLDDVNGAIAQARAAVAAFDPELVVIFSPDHYNGFFYRTMPPFAIGSAACGVGDYGTQSGPLNVPGDLAIQCVSAVMGADVDVALSAAMDVDHGTVQPLQGLFGDATAKPVIPIFINSVATPLGPVRRVRALGSAVGQFLSGLGKRVLIVGSGGLSHDPPVPTLATAPLAAHGRIVHGEPMGPEGRMARQQQVMTAADEFAHGNSPLHPLNPDWDRELLALLDSGRIDEVDSWTNEWIASTAGNSAHEVRTWIAAFSALATAGAYRSTYGYYKEAPELLAGFAIRVAVPA